MPVDWELGENKIIELDVLSHMKVQANVSFSPSYFQHPSRAEIYGVWRLLIIVNRTDCGTTVHRLFSPLHMSKEILVKREMPP